MIGLHRCSFLLIWPVLLQASAPMTGAASGDRSLSWEDLDRYRTLSQAQLSSDGRWAAFLGRAPNGADSASTGFLVSLEPGGPSREFPSARRVQFSSDGRRGIIHRRGGPPILVDLDRDRIDATTLDGISRVSFSPDAAWLAASCIANGQPVRSQGGRFTCPADDPQSWLLVVGLEGKGRIELKSAESFSFSQDSSLLAFVRSAGEEQEVLLASLADPDAPTMSIAAGASFGELHWGPQGWLALLEENRDAGNRLWLWEGKGAARMLLSRFKGPSGVLMPSGPLSWSRDGQVVLLGLQPAPSGQSPPAPRTQAKVEIWHSFDDLLHPSLESYSRAARPVYGLIRPQTSEFRQITFHPENSIDDNGNSRSILLSSGLSSMRQADWTGLRSDLFAADLRSGAKTKLADDWNAASDLSPSGRYALFFDQGHWKLFDFDNHALTNRTALIGVPFHVEDHDLPKQPGSHGLPLWLGDESAALIHDGFDLWRLPLPDGQPECLTGGKGRLTGTVFRARTFSSRVVEAGSELPLIGIDARTREHSLHILDMDRRSGLKELYRDKGRIRLLGHHASLDRWIFSRETYGQSPELWVSDSSFASPRRISDLNGWLRGFDWGHAELFEWQGRGCSPGRAALIKPSGYRAGRRYPVLVSVYEKGSFRLNRFPSLRLGANPILPIFSSDGYVVFLPDLRFRVGRPGPSALDCIESGVEALIQAGIADTDAIGLQGHSWGAYLTTFIITQSKQFSAAAAGAPVTDLLGAYNDMSSPGWSRQRFYESGQGRMGVSFWADPDLYRTNSPIHFAHQVNTPLLMLTGGRDGRVAWRQGLAMHLALRRLHKTSILLHYPDEGHLLRGLASRRDFSVRLKQFFDHYLLGRPKPDWMGARKLE